MRTRMALPTRLCRSKIRAITQVIINISIKIIVIVINEVIHIVITLHNLDKVFRREAIAICKIHSILKVIAEVIEVVHVLQIMR